MTEGQAGFPGVTLVAKGFLAHALWQLVLSRDSQLGKKLTFVNAISLNKRLLS